MDASPLSEGSTWEEVPAWVGLAKLGERAGFAAASLMYGLPFIYLPHGGGGASPFATYRYGIELFFLSLNEMLVGPWPSGVLFLTSFSLPLLWAIAGLLLQKGRGRVAALARVLCAVAGLSCLALVFLRHPFNWQLGFYGAALGFAVAAVAAVLRSLAAFRYPADESG